MNIDLVFPKNANLKKLKKDAIDGTNINKKGKVNKDFKIIQKTKFSEIQLSET